MFIVNKYSLCAYHVPWFVMYLNFNVSLRYFYFIQEKVNQLIKTPILKWQRQGLNTGLLIPSLVLYIMLALEQEGWAVS